MSYSISLLIAKTAKTHTIGENLIKHVIAEQLKEYNNMKNNIEQQLYVDLNKYEFSMQIDASTVRNIESLLMCYVSYIKDKEYNEDIFFKSR